MFGYVIIKIFWLDIDLHFVIFLVKDKLYQLDFSFDFVVFENLMDEERSKFTLISSEFNFYEIHSIFILIQGH